MWGSQSHKRHALPDAAPTPISTYSKLLQTLAHLLNKEPAPVTKIPKKNKFKTLYI